MVLQTQQTKEFLPQNEIYKFVDADDLIITTPLKLVDLLEKITIFIA